MGLFVTFEGNGTIELAGGQRNDRYALSPHTFFLVDRHVFGDLAMARDLMLMPEKVETTGRIPYLTTLCESIIETLILQRRAFPTWSISFSAKFF